jgi:hypothetical protein
MEQPAGTGYAEAAEQGPAADLPEMLCRTCGV